MATTPQGHVGNLAIVGYQMSSGIQSAIHYDLLILWLSLTSALFKAFILGSPRGDSTTLPAISEVIFATGVSKELIAIPVNGLNCSVPHAQYI